MTIRLLLSACLMTLGGCSSISSTSLEASDDKLLVVKSYGDARIIELVQVLEPRSTLFVFDVDNTLLESPAGQFFASDQWYKWQRKLAADDPAKTDCLLDMQGVGYLIAHLEPTERGQSANFVRRMQEAGFDAIAMTARSPQFRSSTERELLRNGFNFRNSQPGTHIGFPGTYAPKKSSHNANPRDASYQNGIAMLAGQHKGDSLVDLLERIGVANEYRTVVFFDDDKKNTNAVMQTFSGDQRAAFVIEYTAVATSLDQYDIDATIELQKSVEELYDQFFRLDRCDI